MRSRLWQEILAMLLLALASQEAAAQSPADEAAISDESDQAIPANENGEKRPARAGLQEIVVTAQKREESLQDVPISVQAFSGEAMEAAGINSAASLPSQVPGLTVTTQLGFTSIFMRGIGSDAFLLADPSVVTYIDNVYFPFSAGLIQDFGTIERIEVLKGPQGTLFGRNAIGGAINIVSENASTAKHETSVSLELGSDNRYKTRAYTNIPMTDELAFSLSGVFGEGENPLHGRLDAGPLNAPDLAGNPLPKESARGFRAKMRWMPVDFLTIDLAAYYLKQAGVATTFGINTDPSLLGRAAGITAQDPYHGATDEHPYSSTRSRAYSAQTLLQLDPLDIKLIGSIQRTFIYGRTDFDGSTAPVASFEAEPGLSKSKSAELQFLSNDSSWGSGWLEWIGGLYYFRSDSGYDPDIARVALTDLSSGTVLGIQVPQELLDQIRLLDIVPLPSGAIYIRGLLGAESIAGFAQTTAHLSDQWSVTLGARAQEERRHVIAAQAGLLNMDGSATLYNNFSSDRQSGLKGSTKRVNPKVSIEYRPDLGDWLDEGMVYLSWQKATKSFTFNAIAVTPSLGIERVKPEDIEAYELGFKGRFFGGLAQINGALFHYDLKNQQVQFASLLSGGLISFNNAGSVRSRGFDVDLSVLPLPQLDQDLVVRFSACLLDARYTSFKDGSGFDPATGLLTQNNDYTGNRVVRSPKVSGTAGISQTLRTASGSVELAVDYYYNSGFYYLAQNGANNEEGRYATLGARVSYLYEPWDLRITAFGTNITSSEYNYSRYRLDFGSLDAAAPKALYGIRLNWAFGS